MKRYVFAGCAFCLVIGFQNCSPQKLSDVNASDSLNNPTEVVPSEKIDVSQTEILEIPESPYLEAQLQKDIQQVQPDATFASHHLEIDVKTGVIHVLDQSDEIVIGVQYCLSSGEVAELRAILDSSKICEEKAEVAGQVCTMNYTFPYATLLFSNSELALGESTSGCHKGPDLCGEQKDLLQGFLAHVQNQLSSKKCEFQVVQK